MAAFHIFSLPCPVCVCGAVPDVAGGYSASMLDAVRRALDASKVLTIQDPKYKTLSFEEVFRIATLGGSQGKPFKTRSYLVNIMISTIMITEVVIGMCSVAM